MIVRRRSEINFYKKWNTRSAVRQPPVHDHVECTNSFVSRPMGPPLEPPDTRANWGNLNCKRINRKGEECVSNKAKVILSVENRTIRVHTSNSCTFDKRSTFLIFDITPIAFFYSFQTLSTSRTTRIESIGMALEVTRRKRANRSQHDSLKTKAFSSSGHSTRNHRIGRIYALMYYVLQALHKRIHYDIISQQVTKI